MGDRNNPIKFGPEWLRNLSRERGTWSPSTNSPNSAMNSTHSQGAAGSSSHPTTSSPPTTSVPSHNTNTSKIQLAKLRYGREEMLALYDGNAEAPQELKYSDVLYQARGKPPFALNSTFDDAMRDGGLRSGPPIGHNAGGERFGGPGRGTNRTVNNGEGRGRGGARAPFVRMPPGRSNSWHAQAPRLPGFGSGADEDLANMRPWGTSNGGNTSTRTGNEQTEWVPSKTYRNKRQGNNTNWRQQPFREEGEEWRSMDSGRPRNNQDKWERDWGERTMQERPQSLSNSRRWGGADSQTNDDTLPEWAMDGSETGGGSFDASGAFHGYSNDDSNLPKTTENPYPLARSHTHSFTRSRTAEEGSEEWWSSEKAKKLSPKRFDTNDTKFKKTPSMGVPDARNINRNSKPCMNDLQEIPEKQERTTPEVSENACALDNSSYNNKKTVRFAESKTFDALMRNDINIEEANDERGNFQSVIIAANNSLRQKHQNIVSNEPPNRNERRMHHMDMVNPPEQIMGAMTMERDHHIQHSANDDPIEDIFDMALEDKDILNLPSSSTSTSNMGIVRPQIQQNQSMSINTSMSHGLQNVGMPNSVLNASLGLPINNALGMSLPNIPASLMLMPNPGMPCPGISNLTISNTMLQNAGMPNSGMNNAVMSNPGMSASGLLAGMASPGMSDSMSESGMSGVGVPNAGMPNAGMSGPGISSQGMQGPGMGMGGFPPNTVMPGMSASNVGGSSLFLAQNSNNSAMQPNNDMQMPNAQGNMFPMHNLQPSGSQVGFGSSLYGNLMQHPPPELPANMLPLPEQWYYEDPKKVIQGPFSSKDMYNWYRAGFFSPNLLVRRGCDSGMRPLGTYGPVVPFAQLDMMSPYSMAAGFEQPPAHEMIMNPPQPAMGLEQVESLWSPQPAGPDVLWIQRAIEARNEQLRNMPTRLYYWDPQPSTITSNSLLPEDITKQMKTEDQILAQITATQNVQFLDQQAKDNGAINAPNLAELQKMIPQETLNAISNFGNEPTLEAPELEICIEEVEPEKAPIAEPSPQEAQIQQPNTQNKTNAEIKPTKTKPDAEKPVKNKESNNVKNKSKKSKEEKKDEIVEVKVKEDEIIKNEKSSAEPSPSKSKKEEKANKKDLEKEKKEWLKEGFTIVKGPEKSTNKDNKKKAEEMKVAEDLERKRKDEDKQAADEEKKRKQAEAKKQQQEQQSQQLRQVADYVAKKAPWSAVTNQAMQVPIKDGLTLTEIQKLEREKKLEQMKEQQQMMQIIAQQQAAALAREQEMQAGLGWAKKKGTISTAGQSLVDIQVETRKQATAVAVAAAQISEEAPVMPPPQNNNTPWGNPQNGAGFWDTLPSQPSPKPEKVPEAPKPVEPKPKKKPISVQIVPAKKENTPATEFHSWCTTVLASWSSKIDVPTFIGFLKDIESPYEVKDYVKCYLGESKDSGDFARQFLERRSKLLRVGMVTPSDDLCSPALAVTPRTASGSDYQEVKGKGKKTKKNKMLKVDARILGFSVTAAEDRINVGDIDTV